MSSEADDSGVTLPICGGDFESICVTSSLFSIHLPWPQEPINSYVDSAK